MPTRVIVEVDIVITEAEIARVQPVKLVIAANTVCLEISRTEPNSKLNV